MLLESFWALGTLLAAGLSWLIIPSFGWRWLLVVSGIAGVVIYFIRRYIPESPRYLMVRGRQTEAEKIIRFVAEENGVPLDNFEISPVQPAAKTTLADLWKPSLRRITICPLGDLVLYFAGILWGVHLDAGLFPDQRDDPHAGLPEFVHPGIGAIARVFFGRLFSGENRPAEDAGILSPRQRRFSPSCLRP